MYCRNCGHKIGEDVKFCPNCGTDLQPKEDDLFKFDGHANETAATAEEKPARVWTVFALVSKILGIVSIATAAIPYINYITVELAIVGIVLSCLGRKAQTEETDNNCRIGLILSIIAEAVSIVMIFVYAFAFAGLMTGVVWSYY